MDIKDSYLHNTVGVIKSIDIEEDKLKYNLADKNNTEKVITLPLATQNSNGLLSKNDKIIIDSVSDQLTKPHYLQNNGDMSVGWIRIFSGTYQHHGTLSIKHGSGNVKLIIDFINNYSSLPYIKYINGIPTNTISKIRFVKNGDYRYIDIYNNFSNTITISFSSRDTRYQSSLPMILVNEDVSSYTVYEYDLYSGNWSNMSYISNKFIGNLQGNADTATEATHATNSDNATRANFATEATHAVNTDEAIHSETADLADDLGGKPETHEENFIYQPTAADLSIKDGFADIKKLKGNTVVWNQKFINKAFTNNGVSITTSEDVLILNGTLNNTYLGITSGTSSVVKIPLNHIGYYKIVILKDNNNILQNRFFALFNRNKSATITQNTAKFLYQNTNDSLGWGFGISKFSGREVFEDVQIKANVFDLTQMFGEGNEPTIEEFEAMFPNDYYEYNEGELLSFDGKGVKSVGFNQWDEEMETGKLNTTTGNNLEDTSRIRSKNYIKVFPSTKYYFTSPTGTSSSSVWIALYDKNYNIIQGYNGSGLQTSGNMFNIILAPDRNREFTTSPNAAYMRFYISTEFSHGICINLVHSGYRNGEYEPYEDYTLSFQDGKTISQLTGKLNGEGESVVIFPDGLRSAGEAFDEITYDKSTSKHKAIKRIGGVDMGTLDWRYNSKYLLFYARFFEYTKAVDVITAKYINDYRNTSFENKKDDSVFLTLSFQELGKISLLVKDSSYTDVNSFKASLQGQILYYELAEPEIYELDFPINTSYEAYDFGTEEVLYSDDKKVNIPMKANIEYGFNAVDMIRGNYFDIQKLKKKTITTEIDVPILVHGHDDVITYNPNFTLNKFNEYLPLAGGSMSGNIDMRGNEIKNTNFELVESLPTENLYEGRQVTYNGKIYTYHNGKWISTADDLGDLKEILSSEFVFRPTADTHSVKDEFASVKSIKGNTVIWNQLDRTKNGTLVWNGLTLSLDNGILTINGTATVDNTFYGVSHEYKSAKSESRVYHKINISGDFIGSKESYVTHSLGGNSSYFKLLLDSELKQIKGINKADKYTYFSIKVYSGDIFTNVKIQSQLINLTRMFGEGNEPATVEEFEKLYSHLPTDYNEGSLLNINADSIKSVGFNLFDKTKVESNSYLYSTTGISTYSKNLKENVSDFIRVIPSTKYYVKNIISGDHRTAWVYDSNKIPLTVISVRTTDNIDGKFLASMKITIPDNAHYIRFGIYDEYLDSACINLVHSGYRDGEYELYEEHIVNLPIKKYFPDGLKSAGAVYDEIVFDKNIGKYKAIQRIGSVDMGTLNWTYNDGSSNPTSYPYGFFQNSLIVRKPGRKTIKCVKYLENVDFQVDKRIAPALYQSTVYIIDSSYTDVDSLKTSLQGQILYYELAEPIETIIEDYDLIAYKVNDWGTEEIISEEPTTPIKADIEYNFDGNEIIKYNYFRIDEIKKDYLHKDEIAVSAEKLARPVKLWGNNFDGSYDVNGIINYGLKVNNTEDRISLLNIESVASNINYSHLYVTSTDESDIIRPLVLLKGYGNVGIGLETPTEKLEVLGNVKATSFKGNLDWSNVTNKPTSFKPETHTHSELTWKVDVRNVETSVDDYSTKFKFVGIKSPESLGLTKADTGSWLSLFGWRGYTDKTGPHTYELASDSTGKLRVRSGATSFGNWYTIAYTSDLSKYQPLISDLETIRSNANYGKTAYDWYQSVTKDDTDTLINKWGEIVDFLDSVTEGTDIIDEFVTRKTNLTITGLKTFQSNSDTTGISLILKNNAWERNISTALDFYSGRMYTVPNVRIESKMVGGGNSGGNLIFYTLQKSEQNPNPNVLTERMRIDDLGKISITGPLFINGTNSTSANLAFSRSGYNYITFPSDGYLAIGKDTSGAGTYVKFTSTDLRPERSNEINLGSSTNLFKNIYSDKIITTTDVVINNKSLLNILPANNTWSNRLNKQLKDVTTVTDNSYIYIKTPLKCSGSDTDNGMNIIEINIYQHKPSNVATGVSKILLKWYGYDLSLYNYYRSSYAVLGEWVGQVYVGLDSSNNYNIIIHNPNGFNRNTIVSVPYFLSGFNNTVDCSTGWDLGVSLDLSEFTVYKNSVLEQQTSSSFKVLNGTSSQFLKADGSLDSNKYLIAPNNVTNSYVRSININGISYDFLSSINNSSSTTIYSPATSGTQGLVITSSGEGAPVWTNQSSLSTNWNKYTEKSVKLFTKKWTRVLLFNNFNNFLLNIYFSQSSQSSMNTYLINTGWGCAKITQLGYNGYSVNYKIELRICRESSNKFYLDVYNPYGYNNALETHPVFKLINILSGDVSFLTEFLDVTDSTETILDSLISSYNYASNFKSHYSLLSDDSSKLEGSTKDELLQSASSDAASKYLPLTGGTLTGSLNISGGLRLNIYNSSCKLSLTSANENNFIQSASNDFSSNKPLYITGPNANTGSDLYLKFSNIYCRNNYINLDSNNYSTYALPLTGGILSGAIHRTYSHNSSEGDVWICPKDAPQFGIRYFEGDVDKMTISASGNNTSISASDLCINGKGDGTVTIRGNSILHEGNYDSFISPKYSFHKKYSTLSELPEGTEGWYKIGKVMDSSGSPSLFMIKAYAHSSTIFTVIKGWDSGYITILNSTTGGNASYAYIKAIRILNSGEVEILLNKPSTNNSNYVKISISMYNPDNIKLYDTLTLDTNSEITILDSKTLKSNCVISNKFLGEFDLKNVNSENNCVPSNNSVQFFKTTTTNSGTDGYIQSFSWSSGSYVTQMFFDVDSTHKVFLRNRSNEGVWNEWKQFAFTDSNITGSAAKLTSTKIINEQSFTLNNTKWENTGYTFANLESGTYAIQVTSGTNLVASGIMSIYKNLSDTIGDEIPLHVYGTAGWRPYLRTYENKLLISSNDIENTSRTVTIKIALII